MAVSLAAILALLMAPDFISRTPFLPSGCAALLVLIVAGVGPAVVTQLTTVAATIYLMLEPTGSFLISDPGDAGRLAVFLAFFALSDILVLRLERTRRRSDERQAALRESETRYRLLLEQASDGIVLASREGRLLLANQRVCEMLGYTQEELLRLPVEALYAPGDLAERPLGWDQLADTSVVLRERRLRRKDGSTFIAELSVRRTAEGFAQAMVRDITDRRRSEEALRAERDLLDGILATSVAGIIVVNPDGRPLFLNPQAERVLGVGRDQLVDLGDLPPGSRLTALDGTPIAEHQRPARVVVATGEPVEDLRVALHRPDGSRRVLSINAAPLRDAERRVTAVVISVADITESYTAQEAIRTSEEKLLQVTGAMPGVVYQFVVDGDGTERFTFVSERALEFLGVGTGEILGDAQAAWAMVLPEDRARMQEAFRRALATLEPYSFDFRVRVPEGQLRWLRDIAMAVPARDAGQVIWNGVIIDVTERKRLEEQLLQSQKMDSLGRLAGGVAHDFNNLLTVIRGYADVLHGELAEGDPRQVEVREIRRAADRATALTRQLLAVSRRQVLVPRDVDLNQLVGEMERMLRRVIGEDITIGTEVGEDIGWVRADAGQLEQVLLNLAVNARDAMPRGGRLTVRTQRLVLDDPDQECHRERGVPPGDYVVLEVQDTGTGMDPETASKVFEPFFTTKGVGEGTGLGLSTVYGIVQQSSGYITVDSVPGEGTTFRIFLPRHERGTAPPEVVRERPTPRTARRPATVLLVEDDDGVRQLTQRVLEEYGYSVLGARNGEEALALLDVGGPAVDVVVSDVVMPGMGGRELAGRLRLRSPDLPVLFLSGYTGDEVADPGREFPRQAFLQKPYSPDVLVTSIDQLLASRRAAGEAPATAG